MEFVRLKIRQLVLSITGILLFLLSIRLILNLLGNNENSANGLINLLYSLSSTLFNPFEGIANNLSMDFDFNVVLAMIVILLIGMMLGQIISSVVHLNGAKIIKDLVDSFFKIIEFILLFRVIFDYFELNFVSLFGESIQRYSEWSSDLIISNKLIEDKVSLSMLIILLIIIILDLLTETIISRLLDIPKEDNLPKGKKNNQPKLGGPRNSSFKTQPRQIPRKNLPQNQQPVYQTINIQIPPSNPNKIYMPNNFGQNNMDIYKNPRFSNLKNQNSGN